MKEKRDISIEALHQNINIDLNKFKKQLKNSIRSTKLGVKIEIL